MLNDVKNVKKCPVLCNKHSKKTEKKYDLYISKQIHVDSRFNQLNSNPVVRNTGITCFYSMRCIC